MGALSRVLLLPLAAAIACTGDGPLEPPPEAAYGMLEISVTTSGADTVAGYVIHVGDVVGRIANNDSVTFILPAGAYEVTLAELPQNCTPDRRSIDTTVTSRDTTEIEFAVSCRDLLGQLVIVTTTSGPAVEHDSVTVDMGIDCYENEYRLGINDTLTLELRPGLYSLILSLISFAPSACTTPPSYDWYKSALVQFDSVTAIRYDMYCFNTDLRVATRFSWLQDSRYLVFDSDRSPPGIYVARYDGSELHMLSEGTRPSPSPDGTEVAYSRTSAETGQSEIFVIGIDGTGEQQLTTEGGFGPSWTPDGAAIVFHRQAAVPPDDVVMTNLHMVASDGSAAPRQITFGGVQLPGSMRDGNTYQPKVSPDGTSILFASTRGGGRDDLYKIEIVSGVLTQLTDDPAQDTHPDWAPDGTQIAYCRAGSGVYVMNADGSGQHRLLPSPIVRWSYNPAWSPDGSSIAFQSYGALTVGADGSGATRIAWGGMPRWSPDGTKVAVVLGKTIFVVNADGSWP